MTNDRIIALAKEAGFFISGGWVYSSSGKGHHINESLSRFRDLVLEEAAAVCDAESRYWYEFSASEQVESAELCAKAIRELKREKP